MIISKPLKIVAGTLSYRSKYFRKIIILRKIPNHTT